MDYFLKRERRHLIDDLVDLQREEDLQKKCRAIIKSLERSRYELDDDDDEDEDRNFRNRKKKFCLIKLIYRNRRGNIDEIKINQSNQIIYKGCLQDGDQFLFKTKSSRNNLRLKLKFYINDILEDEMIACCEYGLMNRNQRNHFFQIENIIGAKPCDDCESDDNNQSRSTSPILERITTKHSTLSKENLDQNHKEKIKEKQSNLSVSQSSEKKHSNEDFSTNINEFSDYHTPSNDQLNDVNESEEDSISNIPSPTLKNTYGPPQLSTMLSRTESLDLPTPNVRQSTSGDLFNSSTKTQQNTNALTNSNLAYNLSQSDKYLSRQSSIIESNQTGPELSTALTMANDATQLLLTQIGIIQQEQVESSGNSNVLSIREKGNVEYFILIYLNELNPDESIIKQLRSYINFLKIFHDTDDCIAFINTIIHEKIILILNNSFCESILSRIQELPQIYTIHILGENEAQYDRISKVQGFYNDIKEIYQAISNDINKISRDLIIYLNTSLNVVSFEPVIIYFLLLNEIILDKTETKNDLKDLITFVKQEYDENEEELKIIDQFEKTYEKNQAIYWFSRSCFISKMLNKALRIPQPDILFRLRLFIQDLFHQIKSESTKESIIVYLGQTIQRNDLNDLQINITNNDIIIFPQFLFGSTDELQAIRIAKEIPLLNDDVIPLIIRLEIPKELQCANLDSYRYSRDDDNNVLLNMGIMGRLIKIEKDNIKDNHIASIHVKLIDSSDQRNFEKLLEITRTEIKSFSPFVSMIKLMLQMNQYLLAEQLIKTLFNEENLKSDTNLQGSIAAACHILAQFNRNQNNYQHALDLYLISLETFKRIISPNAFELSTLYSNIGSMYFRLEQYNQSYEYYQKALDIQLHSNTPDLYSISTFTNSIGIIYSKQKKYPEAIQSFERTLKILQQISEPHDAELAATYDDLGDTYLVQLKFDEALNNYSKGLEIQEHMESRNSQNLATSYHTIGNIYLKLGRSKEALYHLKHALEYFQENISITHPTLALLHNNIGLMYYREEQYEDALKYYSKTLEIANLSLPDNHTLVGITLFNIALVYSSQEKYDEAIETIEKSTKQFLKTLPPDHIDIQENNKYIQTIKQKQILKNIFNETTINS